MTSPSTKKSLLSLQRLNAAQTFDDEAARAVLTAALRESDPRVVLEAAQLIARETLYGYEPMLADAYRRFAGERAVSDAGCLTKEALLAALDGLDHGDAELFAEAALYVQRGKSGGRDTAGRVRARAVLALARLGHRDLWPLLGAALGDEEAQVRLSAARAVGHRGHRDGAGLLLVRLAAGDSEAEVFAECLKALFAVAPDLARPRARALLEVAEARRRECVLHALGTAPADAAVELLGDELARLSLDRQRREVIEALGLSLRPFARTLLIELVRSGRSSDAEAALTALAIHRYDSRLREQLADATARDGALKRRFAELYRE